MKRKDVIKFLILRTLGNFFLLFTIFGFFATFGPALYYEILYRIGTTNGVTFTLAASPEPTGLGKILEENSSESTTPVPLPTSPPQPGFLEAILSGQKEQILIPRSTEFSVVIPKIGANEKVIINTDPSSEEKYLDVLKQGVAHAQGSAFPGLNGTIYMFAHSADNFWNIGRYNAVFYLVKELVIGDEIVVFFQNKRYDYTVYDKQIVDAADVSHIDANIGQGEKLILQTCWPPGTAWKRLLIFARPKST